MRGKSRGFVLAETLRKRVSITHSELSVFKTHFLQKLKNDSLSPDVKEYLDGIRRRIAKIEQRWSEPNQGLIVLLLMAVELDDDAFDSVLEHSRSWLSAVDFGQTGRLGVDTVFVAIKLLLAMPPEQILKDEIRKELRRKALQMGTQQLSRSELQGSAWKKAIMTARQRVQRGKKLARAMFPYLVRGFAEEFTQNTPRESVHWVKVG